MSSSNHWILLLLVIILLGGCDGSDHPVAPEPYAVFEVEVAGQETFRVALEDPAQIAIAEQLLADGQEGIVYGALVRGDGGFNTPYSWHLKPETVTFPDLTIEACSGRPMSDVEADLDYWVDTLGEYCPWGSRIVQRVTGVSFGRAATEYSLTQSSRAGRPSSVRKDASGRAVAGGRAGECTSGEPIRGRRCSSHKEHLTDRSL